jgi:hypothetical protein
MFQQACKLGCGGIVSKLGSPYRSGRVDLTEDQESGGAGGEARGGRGPEMHIQTRPTRQFNSMLPAIIHGVRYLVQMGIDLARQLIELIPLLAEFRGFMSRLQEIATLPLDVIDDATPVEAAMQADGNEPGLARHEAGPLSHQ